jgi:hypothetical protein
MNSPNKKSPAAGVIPQPSNRQAVAAPQIKHGATQLKTAVSAQSVKRPVAPPAYRPQATPKAAQPKMARGAVNRRPPVAPPVYRPQPAPKVLQTKTAHVAQPPRHQPATPPVRRPQPVSEVLQPKVSTHGAPAAPARPNPVRPARKTSGLGSGVAHQTPIQAKLKQAAGPAPSQPIKRAQTPPQSPRSSTIQRFWTGGSLAKLSTLILDYEKSKSENPSMNIEYQALSIGNDVVVSSNNTVMGTFFKAKVGSSKRKAISTGLNTVADELAASTDDPKMAVGFIPALKKKEDDYTYVVSAATPELAITKLGKQSQGVMILLAGDGVHHAEQHLMKVVAGYASKIARGATVRVFGAKPPCKHCEEVLQNFAAKLLADYGIILDYDKSGTGQKRDDVARLLTTGATWA